MEHRCKVTVLDKKLFPQLPIAQAKASLFVRKRGMLSAAIFTQRFRVEALCMAGQRMTG